MPNFQYHYPATGKNLVRGNILCLPYKPKILHSKLPLRKTIWEITQKHLCLTQLINRHLLLVFLCKSCIQIPKVGSQRLQGKIQKFILYSYYLYSYYLYLEQLKSQQLSFSSGARLLIAFPYIQRSQGEIGSHNPH